MDNGNITQRLNTHKTVAKDFKTAMNELLQPSGNEWVHASLRTVPPGIIEVLEAYQAASYRLVGPGKKPNRATALTWLTACALSDGDAMGKIQAMNELYLEKQRAALVA